VFDLSQVEVFAKVCLEGSKLAGKSIKVLVDAGIVTSIPDLYSMTSVRNACFAG